MTQLDVRAELVGKKLHRLEIFFDGKYIGEYERSQAQDIERKVREIDLASDFLIAIYEKHGPFVVRWDGKAREKSVRIEGTQVAELPHSFWQKPSWE